MKMVILWVLASYSVVKFTDVSDVFVASNIVLIMKADCMVL
jgi:hypothetical protein